MGRDSRHQFCPRLGQQDLGDERLVRRESEVAPEEMTTFSCGPPEQRASQRLDPAVIDVERAIALLGAACWSSGTAAGQVERRSVDRLARIAAARGGSFVSPREYEIF
jgi:hypothetical protein